MAFLTPGTFSRTHMMAIFVSLCGVVLIAKPSLLLGYYATVETKPPNPSRENFSHSQDARANAGLLPGVMFAMLGALGGAVSITSSVIIDLIVLHR